MPASSHDIVKAPLHSRPIRARRLGVERYARKVGPERRLLPADFHRGPESTWFVRLSRRYEGLDAKSDPLVAILAAVSFELFRPRLKAALVAGGLRTADADRKSAAGRH